MAVTDNFNRADGGLGANWTTIESDPPVIASNHAQGGDASNYGAAAYTAVSFNATQSSQIVKGVGNYIGPGVRMNTTGGVHWVGYFNNGTIQKNVAGSVSTVATDATFGSSDTAKLSVNGTSYTPSVNGVDGTPVTISDAGLASGSPGLVAFEANGEADNWEGTGEIAGGGSTVPVKRLQYRRRTQT